MQKLIGSFAELEEEFIRRVHSVVWCNVATLDRRNRPRSRILHTIWEGATGWAATFPHSPKAAHLAHNPYVSLAYVQDVANPVYVDCLAEWQDDPTTRRRVWDLFATAPPPLGYDPAPIFKSPNDPTFGILRFTPWRVELVYPPAEHRVWRA